MAQPAAPTAVASACASSTLRWRRERRRELFQVQLRVNCRRSDSFRKRGHSAFLVMIHTCAVLLLAVTVRAACVAIVGVAELPDSTGDKPSHFSVGPFVVVGRCL